MSAPRLLLLGGLGLVVLALAFQAVAFGLRAWAKVDTVLGKIDVGILEACIIETGQCSYYNGKPFVKDDKHRINEVRGLVLVGMTGPLFAIIMGLITICRRSPIRVLYFVNMGWLIITGICAIAGAVIFKTKFMSHFLTGYVSSYTLGYCFYLYIIAAIAACLGGVLIVVGGEKRRQDSYTTIQ